MSAQNPTEIIATRYLWLYMNSSEKNRLDKYLWAIRIFKTRTQATKACEDGKVKLAGQNVKPAHSVAIGERYDIKTQARKWTIEVSSILQNRLSYEEAVKHYVDLTSDEDRQPAPYIASSFFTGKRLSKTGRPTKKQRRDLGDILGNHDAD